MAGRNRRRRQKSTELLVSKVDSDLTLSRFAPGNRDNLVPQMSPGALGEVRNIIEQRYLSAETITEEMTQRMYAAEKQYKGEWLDPDIDLDKNVFIPKTREHVDRIHAYFITLISQMTPVVTMQPKLVGMSTPLAVQYERAKIMEAMFHFYFSDVWKTRDDKLPTWLKHLLKFPQAIWKVSYYETDSGPDLDITVVDRAMLYIDPDAKTLKAANWVIEKYYMTRAEVCERIDQGYWHVKNPAATLTAAATSSHKRNNETRKKPNNRGSLAIEEDDQIEIWDYWQANSDGLSDVYAVQIGGPGGELVRYGRNPFPYKGLPYRGQSYNTDDNSPDGISMVEQETPFQRVINLYFNMRLEDVSKNIIQATYVHPLGTSEETRNALADGEQLIPMPPGMQAYLDANPGRPLSDLFYTPPNGTSTDKLLQGDLPFVLGLNKESSQISDVFAGQAPPHQATLGQVQEQMSQNQGVLRPIFLRVMRSLEEIAEISVEYFKDPEFFPANRVIQIVGENKYLDTIRNWEKLGNTYAREVSPDDMDVDVNVNAVNQADAMASKTFLMSSMQQFFGAIGQVPGLAEEARGSLNFAKIFSKTLDLAGHDAKEFEYSDEEKQARSQQQQQQQQQQLQQQQQAAQAQLRMETEAKAQLTEREVQAKTMGQIGIDASRQGFVAQNDAARASETLANELEKNSHKAALDFRYSILRMEREAALERQTNTQLGHGNNINE